MLISPVYNLHPIQHGVKVDVEVTVEVDVKVLMSSLLICFGMTLPPETWSIDVMIPST